MKTLFPRNQFILDGAGSVPPVWEKVWDGVENSSLPADKDFFHVSSYSRVASQSETSVEIGLSWPTINFKPGPVINAIRNRFGLRAELNRLILAATGHNTLKKFLRVMGEENTKRGRVLREALVERMGKESGRQR